jgi:hypothetical protein
MAAVAAFAASAETVGACNNNCNFAANQFAGKRRQSADVAFRIDVVNDDIAALVKAGSAQALAE